MKNIYVLDRGWVLVGDEIGNDQDYINIENSYVIRRWGTVKGLGEIAKGGPTENTILDENYETRINKKSLIFSIKCDEDNWKI